MLKMHECPTAQQRNQRVPVDVDVLNVVQFVIENKRKEREKKKYYKRDDCCDDRINSVAQEENACISVQPKVIITKILACIPDDVES